MSTLLPVAVADRKNPGGDIVDAVGPHVHVVPVGQIALAKPPILGLPGVREPRDSSIHDVCLFLDLLVVSPMASELDDTLLGMGFFNLE